MPKYRVYQRWFIWSTMDVEAENEDAALDKVCDMQPPEFCIYCSPQLDGDVSMDQRDDSVDVREIVDE